MIIANAENNITEYAGENNVIVFPITNYVRKDGNIVLKNDIGKKLVSFYPTLKKKIGYMINNGVKYPSISSESINLLGIPERNHYASAIDKDLLLSGFWYVKEQAFLNPNKVFYVFEDTHINKDELKEIFDLNDNVVFLRKENNDE